jgi:hypothetical protein
VKEALVSALAIDLVSDSHLPLYTASARPDALVFWRRRMAAVAVLLVALIGLIAGARTAASALGAAPAASPGGAAASIVVPAAPTGPRVYVVRKGDTVTALARAVMPGHDPADLIAQVEARYGTAELQPGQRIVLP